METKTLENIKKQCALRGMTIASLERRLDYSNGSIAKAKTLPSDRLYEISKFFGVTMEYMMFCGTDTPFEADSYIVAMYESLNEEGRQILEDYAEFLQTKYGE